MVKKKRSWNRKISKERQKKMKGRGKENVCGDLHDRNAKTENVTKKDNNPYSKIHDYYTV